jgi:D-inositol-3-phosphate glycosyltransferase
MEAQKRLLRNAAVSEATIAIIDPLGKYGGLHYYIDGLARGLRKTGRRVLVYVPTFTGVTGCEPYEAFASFGKLYGTDPVLLRGWRYLCGLIASTSSAKYRGANAVNHHLFNYGLKEVAAVWLARILGMKVILTLHDVESFGRPGLRLMRSLILAGASGFIMHNRFSMVQFERSAEAMGKPLVIVPHGHYADHFPQPERTEARAFLNLPMDPMIFLFFGNCRFEKGLDLLVEACAGMKDRPGWLLLVAGKMKPDQLKYFRSLIDRYGLGDFTRVDAKHVSDEEALAYYGAADLIVVPYRHIYESGVTIMAMSLSRAVLVSNLEPLVESIAGGEAGLVFKSEDAKALRARLMQAMDERSSLDSIGARAHAHVIATRDWTKIGERTAKFVDKICGSRQ